MDQPVQPTPPQTSVPEKPATKPRSNAVLIFIGIFVLIIVAFVSFYLGQQTKSPNQALKPTSIPTAIPTISKIKPTRESATATPIPSPTATQEQIDLAAIAEEISAATDPKLEVEIADVSPVDSNSVAYIGHDEKWAQYGIYLFDRETKTNKAVVENTESISGRGGTYLDNVNIKFSPDGKTFFANRTGINFPSFVIATSEAVLYKSDKNLGHAAWINSQKLVYITDTDTAPSEYTVSTKASKITSLPKGIFHLHANTTGTRIAALTLPKKDLQCETFDLKILDYPRGQILKTLANVTINIEQEKNLISYEKVTGCKKNEEEAMFPYSPITQKMQIDITK